MTAQVYDTVFYRDEEYSLVGVNGNRLFEPKAHGLSPTMLSTACWRGFICQYEILDGTLQLKHLVVGTDRKAPAPKVFGVLPRDESTYPLVYENIGHVIPFTGGVLLGAHFIYELYVHMGFGPAWKFRRVHELIIRDGKVVEEADRSREMSELRRVLEELPLEPGLGATGTRIRHWVGDTFDQRYALTIEAFQRLCDERAAEHAVEAAAHEERLKRINAPAEGIARIIEQKGITCPHCQRRTQDIRIMRGERTYFICRLCARSFQVGDLEPCPECSTPYPIRTPCRRDAPLQSCITPGWEPHTHYSCTECGAEWLKRLPIRTR